MTIEEAKEKRAKLESVILGYIQDFERETLMVVERIDLVKKTTIGIWGSETIAVDIDARLPHA